MCGIAGFIDLAERRSADSAVLSGMLESIVHRGPDDVGSLVEGACAIGMRRLSIIDEAGSNQPIFNEDRTLAMVGNGEIFNYVELREELSLRGHVFATNGDLEVALHLYEEMGASLTSCLNGQYSLVILDLRTSDLLLLRDPLGITPLHYAIFGTNFVFGSEIKAILRHPAATAEVDLVGLDQVLCFPGLVSPRTMFKNIRSLPPGHSLTITNGKVNIEEFWDLDYPMDDAGYAELDEREAIDRFLTLFDASVERRLHADVPVGIYLSGGIDSSFLAASARANNRDRDLTTFSIIFPHNRAINERRFQVLMAKQIGSRHIEIPFEPDQVAEDFRNMIWHAECPVSETYNVCSMAMSAAARNHSVKVFLGGEGADELLAGYPGYRFDALVSDMGNNRIEPEEAAVRQHLWGNAAIRYERNYSAYRAFRNRFFSPTAREMLGNEDCLSQPLVSQHRLAGRHPVHQRSYLDIKLRLGDHLLGDHGDRMSMANSVEGRFPFLDPGLIDFIKMIPPQLKINGMDEKYILRKASESRVPKAILKREKFGFRAPGSSFLLASGLDWVEDALSWERVNREGYFDPDAIQEEVVRHRTQQVGANPHAEDDIPLLALSFSMLLEFFQMPSIG